MISIEQMTDMINVGLNTLIAQNPLMVGETDKWVFALKTDFGAQMPASREDNLVTHYIMGQTSVLSSSFDNAGTTQDGQDGTSVLDAASNVTNASMSIGITFLVPVISIEDDEAKELTKNVRAVIDTYFAISRTGILEDEGTGVIYSYSVDASLGATGARDLRTGIGDSIAFIVGADYTFTENGVNSRAQVVALDGEILKTLTFGRMRQSDLTPALPSNQSDGSAKSQKTGTTLAINFTCPVTLDPDGAQSPLWQYVNTGGYDLADPFTDEHNIQPNVAHYLTISRPAFNRNGDVDMVQVGYYMAFASGAENGAGDTSLTASFQMEEADTRLYYPSRYIQAQIAAGNLPAWDGIMP